MYKCSVLWGLSCYFIGFIIHKNFDIIKKLMGANMAREVEDMNYGKESVAKQQKKLAAAGKKRKKKRFHLLRTVCILVLSIIIGAGLFAGLYAKSLIDDLPNVATIDISPTGYMSTVYDMSGNKIETLASSGANRTYVTLDKIPVDLQHAFVAIEDERFYEHGGIDIKGIIRAGIDGVLAGFHFSQGASTITQQLLKNNYFTTWTSEKTKMDSVNRKIQEQYLAIQLEKITSKDTILENYLNSINLGQNTLGVQAAAERYFNKNVADLTLSECAVIASITQNPSKYNPITHPEENFTRRKKVLDNMLKHDYITEAAYKEAIADDVYDRIEIVNNEIAGGSTTYFVDALTDSVVEDLVTQYNYTESQAYQMLYSGGLKIYSTQNSSIQSIVDREVNNTDNYNGIEKVSFSYRLTVNKADGSTKNYSDVTMLSFYQASNPKYDINYASEEDAAAAIEKYKEAIMEPGDTIPEAGETVTYTLQPQAAMTVMDHQTGAVVAMTGGRGTKKASKTLNRATGITRQPGSTFKIIATYAAALDAGGLTLASVEDDHPTTYSDGTPLSNYDDHYRGYTNLRTAITYSINVVTVEALSQIGTGLGYRYVCDLGINTLVEGDNNEALALGGITNGVTNEELTSAYATIANGGTYNKPYYYTQVVDHQGNVVLENQPGNNQTRKVLKETTAWLLTSAMKDVMTSGTGGPANFSGMAVAGKSGTTTKNRDTIFAGFTPYYTAVIWGGYDDNTPQSYTTYSKNIWKAVMSSIHSGLEYRDFVQPEGIVQVTVCRKSGKLAVPGLCDCDPRGSQAYTEYFEEGTEPTENCDRHWAGAVCNETHGVATAFCPSTTAGIFIIDGSVGSDDEGCRVDVANGTCYHAGGPLTPGVVNFINQVANSRAQQGLASLDQVANEFDIATDNNSEGGAN